MTPTSAADAGSASAVFSGAGLSGAGPASLPMGNWLRDDVLRTIFDAAKGSPAGGLLRNEHLDAMTSSGHKLEMVLGRLWGVIGDDALACVYSLRVALPNTAHMLAAVHLARGGVHMTVNFDVGIEYAYGLIVGVADLPDRFASFRADLTSWQRLLPRDPTPLTVVTSKAEFDEASGAPGSLLKVHGGLSRDESKLLDVVVVDIEEIGALWPSRRAAVDRLAAVGRLVITGYGGADPDVYRPLLDAAGQTRAEWRCPWFAEGSPVPGDCDDVGVHLVLGKPGGTADALLGLLGIDSAPDWPTVHDDPRYYEVAFAQWQRAVTAEHDARQFAHVWAWIASDTGDDDLAASILERVVTTDDTNARLRLAEVLYARARGDDLARAARLFRELLRGTSTDASARDIARLRIADLARKTMPEATRRRKIGNLACMTTQPAVVLASTRLGRRRPESAADAYRALGQSVLRMGEVVAARGPRDMWPLVGLGLRVGAHLSGRAERLTSNGNRRALTKQHRLTGTALAAVLRGKRVPEPILRDLMDLRQVYTNAGDFPGAGNCSFALAVAAIPVDRAEVQHMLDQACDDHGRGRVDRSVLPSAEHLAATIRVIANRSYIRS